MIEPNKPDIIQLEAEPIKVVEPVRAEVSMGFTRNMGNFESLRIDLGLSASAKNGESAADTLSRVYDFVEARLLEKFAETEEQLRSEGLGEGK